jgi:transposase
VGQPALAHGKKNAQRQHAWLVFEDESGVSQQPVVRRTWAPRGHTPVLTPTGGHWKRLSVAGALAFRWDGRRTRFYFHTHPGSYTDVTLIGFLHHLKRHFRGRRVILIWDGLGAHKSGPMTAYLARQRAWLTVERLPAYAPDLNPIEQVWGNVKGAELANLCAEDLARFAGHCARASRGSGATPAWRSPSCVTRAWRSDMIITLLNETH